MHVIAPSQVDDAQVVVNESDLAALSKDHLEVPLGLIRTSGLFSRYTSLEQSAERLGKVVVGARARWQENAAEKDQPDPMTKAHS